MRWDAAISNYTLASGRKIYAYDGIIGINPNGEDRDPPKTGYDGSLLDFDEANENPLSPTERAEIGAAMVKRWAQWGGL